MLARGSGFRNFVVNESQLWYKFVCDGSKQDCTFLALIVCMPD